MTDETFEIKKIDKIFHQLGSLKKNVTQDEIYTEIVVISNLITSDRNHELIFKLLNIEDFVYKSHKLIFDWSQSIYSKGLKVDLGSILSESKNTSDYTDAIFSEILEYSTNHNLSAESFVLRAKENSLKRKIRDLSRETFNNSKTSDVFKVIENLKSELDLLTNFDLKENTSILGDLAHSTYEKILKIRNRDNEKHNGVHTGFIELDRMTDGFDNGDLILIAARPSMGKTAFALSIARNLAENKIPVAFFSIEMVKEQIMIRLFSQIAKIDSNKFKRGNFNSDEQSKLIEAIQFSQELPLLIDDSASLSVMDLRSKTKKLIQTHGIKALFIDYIGIMKTTKEQNREREISVLSQGLKQIAKDFKIPVIALSQLSRDVEKRAKKEPILADLRDSGGLEQDADQVIFLHRPEYYKISHYSDGTSTENLADVIVAKNRNGPVGDVKVAFIKEFTLFGNIAYGYERPPESIKYERNLQNVGYEDPYF